MNDETAGPAPELDTSELDPAEAARAMAKATDEQLAELMSGPLREQVLGEIFGRMAEHFRADAAAQTEAVIRWRIAGHPERGHDAFETVISGGTCVVRDEHTVDSPRVTLTIDGVDFLRLVTGAAAGPMLFMSGKLKIEGDMLFAANAASLFAVPTA
jgi:putative sterol carrier protein